MNPEWMVELREKARQSYRGKGNKHLAIMTYDASRRRQAQSVPAYVVNQEGESKEGFRPLSNENESNAVGADIDLHEAAF
ncbi:MAG: hypothetical protein ACLSAP_02305 [Oscillospiraceae bacterium]